MKKTTVEAAVSMGHCDHVSPQELAALWNALATVTAERDSLRSTRRKLHDALTLAHEQHSELCREFHAERAAWLVEKLNARGANVT